MKMSYVLLLLDRERSTLTNKLMKRLYISVTLKSALIMVRLRRSDAGKSFRDATSFLLGWVWFVRGDGKVVAVWQPTAF